MSSTTQTVPRLGTRYSDQDIKRGQNEIAAKPGKDPQSMRMSIPMIEKHLDTQPGTKPLVSPSVQPAPVQPAPVKKTGLFGRLLGNASKLATSTANAAKTAATTAATNAATSTITNNMNLTPEENAMIMECKRIISSKVSKGGKRKISKTRRKNRKSKRHNKKRNNKATRKTHKKKHTKKH